MITRRAFLRDSAISGTGLVIGLSLPVRRARADITGFAPNAFLRIAPDNTITMLVKHLEMGQGVFTGLPQLIAEELDVSLDAVTVEHAPADASKYNNIFWGPYQGTGGSCSVAESWTQMREAGAKARVMLVEAAAKRWGVEPAGLVTENGSVRNPDSKLSLSYGELAIEASGLSVPEKVALRQPGEWKLIGKSTTRTDNRPKVNGSAVFAIDVKRPGMLTAVIARPERFGAKLKSFDASAALAIEGVKTVVEIPEGVAVVADGFWAAKKGRDALKIEWDGTTGIRLTSSDQLRDYTKLMETPGQSIRPRGDAAAAMAKAHQRLEAVFEFPYLAHAPMEPMTCVVELREDGCDVWAGSQLQTMDQMNAAKAAGLRPDQVSIHTVFAGGSFGRRATTQSDFVVEAVNIAKATRELAAPIRLIWTREDDIKGGMYRPSYVHKLWAGLDEDGRPLAWQHRIAGQSVLKGTAFEQKGPFDPTSVEGAADLPYDIPDFALDLHTTDTGVPVLWWRSVGSTHTAFATEVFIDEIAHATGRDPVAFRRRWLGDHPRHRAVLDLAAEKSGWTWPLTRGNGRGVAVHESFNSYVAQVVDVTVKDGELKVNRVVCAVDCGIAVNPDNIRAQMQGGIGYGLAAALHGAITFKDGHVEQSNFHDYPILRMNEMPKIEVHIVPSTEAPTGVGEPGVPPIAPALVNAIFAATGKRIRTLPIGDQLQAG